MKPTPPARPTRTAASIRAARERAHRAATGENRIFRFFRLPRELRDAIYDNLTTEITIKSFDEKLIIQRAPVKMLFTLNSQSRQEYQERIQSHILPQTTTLNIIIEDARLDELRTLGTIRRDIAKICDVQLHLWLYGSNLIDDCLGAECLSNDTGEEEEEEEEIDSQEIWYQQYFRNALTDFTERVHPSSLTIYTMEKKPGEERFAMCTAVNDDDASPEANRRLRVTWTKEGGFKDYHAADGTAVSTEAVAENGSSIGQEGLEGEAEGEAEDGDS